LPIRRKGKLIRKSRAESEWVLPISHKGQKGTSERVRQAIKEKILLQLKGGEKDGEFVMGPVRIQGKGWGVETSKKRWLHQRR